MSRARRLRGKADGGSWDVALRAPSPRLRPYVVGDYCGYSESTQGLGRRREFPVPMVVTVLDFGPPLRVYEGGDPRRGHRHRGGFVAALAPEHALCEHDGFQQGVQVNFTPIGARLVFGLPLSELGAVAPLADLLPRRYRDLAERLQDLPDWDRRFDLLDAVLAERLAAARADTAVVSWGVRRIEQAGGVLSVRGLARELGYSHKHVIALFRDQVGVPPKLLARIVRFDRLLRHLRAGGGGGWAELALQFGYYDQPHLAREVRAFTGLRPSEMRPLAAEVLGQLP